MRIVTGLLAAALLFAFPAEAARAAAFDGKWIAEIPPQAKPCNGTSVLTMVVAGGQIIGQVHTPWGNGSFHGAVGEDGIGAVTFGQDNGTVHFASDHFEMNWVNGRCGARIAMGDRAPTDDQTRQIVAQRMQYQRTFDDLMIRANAGDKNIDYTALRAAYPYTQLWDPYGSKVNSLLNEAKAAEKGGDCQAALEKLETVIRYNFTLDAAHALRADCLEATGQPKSRIENDIANGLVYSLMHSGDGGSEKTAYVVTSMPEEMDVLANNHITVKTRQTQIRGSDGHYYDQVQGLSEGSSNVRTRTLYFDVSSFVAGRLSRTAMVTLAEATLH